MMMTILQTLHVRKLNGKVQPPIDGPTDQQIQCSTDRHIGDTDERPKATRCLG